MRRPGRRPSALGCATSARATPALGPQQCLAAPERSPRPPPGEMRTGRRPSALGCATSARATPALGPQPCLAAPERRRRRCSANGSLREHASAQQIPADCLLHATASPWSPVSVEIDREQEDALFEASSQLQDMTHQQQNVTTEASPKRQRGKRKRSVDASSSNPAAAASRKSLASKDFKDKDGQAISAAKQKIPKWKAPTAKRFRSPVVLARSTGLAWNIGRSELISVLFETPSGFAIFTMLEEDLKQPDAMQNVWANFGADYRVKEFIWLREFREFKDKSRAINDTGVSSDLTEMINSWHVPGRKIAVGKHEYKMIIEKSLGVLCLFDDIVMEVMWGLKNLMHFLVPKEKMKLRNDDRLPMSQGLKMILNRHGFDVKPEMVNDEIIMLTCILLDCEYCDVKNDKPLRLAGEHIKDASGIKTEGWELMKIATALKIIFYPAEATETEQLMFTHDELLKFELDALEYEDRLDKVICMNVYNEMVRARSYIKMTHDALKSLPEIHEYGIE